MKTIHATCTGTNPMLMNPMTEEQLLELWYQASKRSSKKEMKPEEYIEKLIIRDAKGQIGVPRDYFRPALVYAGQFVVFAGKRNFSNAESSLVPAYIRIVEKFLPFKDQKVPWKLDLRRGVLNNRGAKVAVAIARPMFETWAFDVTLEFDDETIDESRVKSLVAKAGRVAGLGDYRPSCQGDFGMFEISRWEVVEQSLKKAA